MTLTAVDPRTETLRLDTFTSFEEARAWTSEWDALVARLDASLYMTPAWCEVWWRHYGKGRELRLTTVRADGELVAVLPFFIDRLLTPFGRARVAKLIGSDSTLTLVDAVAGGEFAEEALALAVSGLIGTDRVDMVHLGPCSATAGSLDAIQRWAAAHPDAALILRDREAGSHTIFDVSGGFDGYLSGLSSHQRSNYRRKLKKLNKEFDVEVDVISDPAALESEFAAFVEMHQTQWQAIGKLGHFGDWPASLEFSWDLVRSLAQADQVRLVRLLADGQVVAYYWCFALNGTYYWRLSGRLFGERWDPFALGRVGVVQMIEVATADGATAIEAGVGSYGYKENLNASSFPVRSLTVGRAGLAARLRARCTLLTGDLLDLAYYRAWYLKFAPRFGALRRPLIRSWIRRRF